MTFIPWCPDLTVLWIIEHIPVASDYVDCSIECQLTGLPIKPRKKAPQRLETKRHASCLRRKLSVVGESSEWSECVWVVDVSKAAPESLSVATSDTNDKYMGNHLSLFLPLSLVYFSREIFISYPWVKGQKRNSNGNWGLS